MPKFYGVEIEESCNRPMDVSEIISLPNHVQDWVLTQLTRWVRENGGELHLLLRDTPSDWAHKVIKEAWNADTPQVEDEPKAVLKRTGRRVKVTSAQVMAARTVARRYRERGEPVPLKVEKIANAKRRDGSPILFGKPDLDDGYVTAEEAATLKPCIDPNVFELADRLVGMHLGLINLSRTDI